MSKGVKVYNIIYPLQRDFIKTGKTGKKGNINKQNIYIK